MSTTYSMSDSDRILQALKPLDDCVNKYNTLLDSYSEKELIGIMDDLDDTLSKPLPIEVWTIAEELGGYLNTIQSMIDYPDDYKGVQAEWNPDGVEYFYFDYDKTYNEYTDKCQDLSNDLINALSEEAEKRK